MPERNITGHIYLITNVVNGKQYVGQTIMTIQLRWNRHVGVALAGAKYPISQAIRKYGRENFTFAELATAKSHDALNELERWYIELYGSLCPLGYNIDFGGGGGKRPPEVGAKISAARRGQKLGRYRPRSAEHARKLSMALTGKPSPLRGKKRSAGFCAKISAAMTGKPGHPHTTEFKEKLRERNKGNTYGCGVLVSPERKVQRSHMASVRPRNANGTFKNYVEAAL